MAVRPWASQQWSPRQQLHTGATMFQTPPQPLAGAAPLAQGSIPPDHQNQAHPTATYSLQTAFHKDICALTTCQNPCFIDPRGVMHNYCSRAHAQADMVITQPSGHQARQHPQSVSHVHRPHPAELSTPGKQPNSHGETYTTFGSSSVAAPSCLQAGGALSSQFQLQPPLNTSPTHTRAAFPTTSATTSSYVANDARSSSESQPSEAAVTSDRLTTISTLVAHGINSVANAIKSNYMPSENTSDIFFYHRGAPYFAFSNFSEYPIVLDGVTWPTTEHYFQARKFKGTPLEQIIRCAPSAREAFYCSHQPNSGRWVQPDWDMIKDGVMLRALRAKFTQHAELRDLLVSTGSRRLVEHTANDHYWADGGDGSGLNRLGQLLMKVRDELRSGRLKDTSWAVGSARGKNSSPSARADRGCPCCQTCRNSPGHSSSSGLPRRK